MDEWEAEDPAHEAQGGGEDLRGFAKYGSIVATILILFTLVAAPAVSLLFHRGPAPLDEAAPLEDFSAARAMVHVEALSQAPRPVGSKHNLEVAGYLRDQLFALGLTPEIQAATGLSNRWPVLSAGHVRNVAVRIPGTAGDQTLLMMAHYDSVPHAPGAGDDAAGVATLLETARALSKSPPLRNDIILLFTDGEEAGLLGARAFLDHPWRQAVELVLNFEGRGSSGAVLLYETSARSQWLIDEASLAVPGIVGTSLMPEVYEIMPNDTDLSVFKDAGIPALNFAFIDGFMNYHHARDVPENLDLRTLQHMGGYALPLARHFGEADLDTRAEQNAIYFNPFGRIFVHYPASWAVPSALVLLAMYWGVMEIARYRRHTTLRGILAGSAVFAAAAVLAAVSAHFGAQELLSRKPIRTVYMSDFYLLAFTLLAVGFGTVVLLIARRRLPLLSLALGAAAWWVIFAWASAILLPGGSALLIWPAIASLSGLVLLALSKDPQRVTPLRALILCLFSLPVLLTATPIIRLFQVALNIQFSAVPTVFTFLVIGLLIPHLFVLLRPPGWALPATLFVMGAGILSAAYFLGDFTSEHPDRDFILYGLDGDTGEAHWITLDENLDVWTGKFFGAGAERTNPRTFFPWMTANAQRAPAASAGIAVPIIDVLSDDVADEKRWLHLRVQSPRQASLLSLYATDDTVVYAADIQGTGMVGGMGDVPNSAVEDFDRFPPARDWRLHFSAVPPGGIEVWLLVDPGVPISIKAVDQSIGLPDLPGFPVPPRPSNTIPERKRGIVFSDTTLAAKSFQF